MPGRQGWYGHFGFDSSAIHVGIHVDVDLVMQVLQHSHWCVAPIVGLYHTNLVVPKVHVVESMA